MKIVFITGNFPHHDLGLSVIINQCINVFTELDVEIKRIDLSSVHPPHFDGESTNTIDKLLTTVDECDAVVVASTSQMYAPTALLQVFLEYLELPSYSKSFSKKHMLLIALSESGGEQSSLNYLSKIFGDLGAYVVSEIGLQVRHLEDMATTGKFIDTSCEDLFRATRSMRQYISPSDKFLFNDKAHVPGNTADLQTTTKHQAVLSEDYDNDIEELSRLFSEKYEGTSTPVTPNTPPPITFPLTSKEPSLPENLEGLTAALPSKLNPKLSAGIKATIQISISGEEEFEGYLCINSNECSYVKGTAPAPDMSLISDTKTWRDILEGKYTAQKAFMIGGLKVRGDFVLLSKLDTLFAPAG